MSILNDEKVIQMLANNERQQKIVNKKLAVLARKHEAIEKRKERAEDFLASVQKQTEKANMVISNYALDIDVWNKQDDNLRQRKVLLQNEEHKISAWFDK